MTSASILARYDFRLPKSRIAQSPVTPRDASRLLALDRHSGLIRHQRFTDLPTLLQPGDLLVVNDSRVFPARLIGSRPTGGRIEVFLLRQVRGATWEVLLGGKVRRIGLVVTFAEGLHGTVARRNADGTWHVRFSLTGVPFWRIVERIGQTPTPPYIKRRSRPGRYQTIYAAARGSVAAPTAGLHFTRRTFRDLRRRGVDVAFVTLHVGYGTFQPLTDENLRTGALHAEYATVTPTTMRALRDAKRTGRRIIAVGTTTVRALETVGLRRRSFSGWITTFIRPPYRFRVVDGMVTNFHLPQSSLLMLVSAFAGRERILRAYRTAVRRRYRFYSFGDAMFIYEKTAQGTTRARRRTQLD